MDKSGILKVGKYDEDNAVPAPDIFLDGEPMKYLKEVRYLGFEISSTGSFGTFLRKITQKAHGILSKYTPFLSDYDINPLSLRLEVAHVYHTDMYRRSYPSQHTS